MWTNRGSQIKDLSAGTGFEHTEDISYSIKLYDGAFIKYITS